MGIIKDLAFLAEDERFRKDSDQKELQTFNWYLNFDENLKSAVRECIVFVQNNKINNLRDMLGDILDYSRKEIFFLAKMKVQARKYRLELEFQRITDATRPLNFICKIFQNILNQIMGKKLNPNVAIGELNKIVGLL